jgi:hypothetical protein
MSSSDSRSRSNNRNDELLHYFISHSGKDTVIRDSILKIFERHRRRPYKIMNKDDLSRSQEPNWLQIKQWIQKSDAVLLILSGGITRYEHTQNWVAFEVGVAAACDPPKPVIAIKGEEVDIPIPYLKHYYSYSSTVPAHQWRESNRDTWGDKFQIVLHPMLSNVNYKPLFPETHCPRCKLSYYYHGPESVYRCPCCSNETLHWKHKYQ